MFVLILTKRYSCFQRASERDVERSKDWYLRRMQERSDARQPLLTELPDPNENNKWGRGWSSQPLIQVSWGLTPVNKIHQ